MEINSSRCWGCDLCASVCPHDAVRMHEVRSKEHIPSNQAKFFNYDAIEIKKK